MKNFGLHGNVYNFSVDYDSIGVDDILDISKHLMKKKISIMFGLSILIRKKRPQIKLKRSRQVWIWTFG